MEFELLADSIKQINDKASSAAKSAVNQLMTYTRLKRKRRLSIQSRMKR